MSNIQTLLQKILSARYGKDVRQSIHDAIEEIDKVADTAQESATKAAESAANSATMASEYENKAEQYKNEAKQFRDEAEVFSPTNYPELVQNVADNTEAIEGLGQSIEAANTSIEGFEQSLEAVNTSIDSFKTETSNSIEELEQSFEATNTSFESFKTETTGSIENLETELTETTSKVDTIIEKADLSIKNTASGEDIHLKDSTDSKIVDFALYGKAKQKTTTGKNFYDVMNTDLKNSYSFMEKSSDSLRVYSNSAYTYVSVGKHVDYTKMQAGKTYTLSAYVTINKGAGCLTLRTDGGQIIIGTSKITSSGWHKVTFALPDKEGLYFSFFATMDTAEIGDVTYSNIQVEEGDTRTEYEPYTGCIASPNPEYPQEIEASGASGSVVVKSCGKNLLRNTLSSQTQNNVSTTVNEDKTVKVNGAASINTGFSVTTYLNKGKYIATGCPTNGSYTTYALLVQPLDSNNNAITTYWDIGNGVVFDIEEDNTKTWVYIARIAQGYTANNLLFKPMLRKCDENGNPIGDDTYEPYQETAATMQTPNGYAGIPVSIGGNYTDENGQQWICDEIVKFSDGTGERIQRIKKVIYDGTNMKFSAKSGSTTNNIFYSDSTTMDFKNPGNNALANVICTHFKRVMRNEGFDGDKPCIYGSTYPNIYFGFGIDSGITTVALANEWLKSNNVTVYYELANPIRTPLTAAEIAEIEKLQTFYPVTNLSNDGDCEMKVTYLADSKNYIDNQLALQAQAQEAAMINMLLLLPEETQAAMIENDTNNLLTESEE